MEYYFQCVHSHNHAVDSIRRLCRKAWFILKCSVTVSCIGCISVSANYCMAALQGSELEVQCIALSGGRLVIDTSVMRLHCNEVWLQLSGDVLVSSVCTWQQALELVLMLAYLLQYMRLLEVTCFSWNIIYCQ